MILIDMEEFQGKILKVISKDIDKIFNETVFINSSHSKDELRLAMIHGMVMASLYTSQCTQYVVNEGKDNKNEQENQEEKIQKDGNPDN